MDGVLRSGLEFDECRRKRDSIQHYMERTEGCNGLRSVTIALISSQSTVKAH